MRFDSELVIGSCRRCFYGHVQVIVCRPLSRRKFRPFPTTFWLMCPYLIHRAGMIEPHGGVHELEEYMRERKLIHEWRKYNILHQTVRINLLTENQKKYLRKYHKGIYHKLISTGIGGMKYTDGINVKCLHLQTASYIALGFHPAGEWLKSKGLCGECEVCTCKKNPLC